MPWHLTVRLLHIALSQLSAGLKMPPALLESWWLRECPAAFWGHWKQWVQRLQCTAKPWEWDVQGIHPTTFLPAVVLVVPLGGL